MDIPKKDCFMVYFRPHCCNVQKANFFSQKSDCYFFLVYFTEFLRKISEKLKNHFWEKCAKVDITKPLCAYSSQFLSNFGQLDICFAPFNPLSSRLWANKCFRENQYAILIYYTILFYGKKSDNYYA